MANAPVVLKLGGALLADDAALAAVWAGVHGLRDAGTPVVLVHGGGPQQTHLAARLGHTPRLVAGRRVTTDLDLDVALWALRGHLNARLVAAAIGSGLSAVGLSGADGPTVRVHRRPPVTIDGERVDFGHVGNVEHVDPELPRLLLGAGYLVVLASVCVDASGALFNVNADTVAMEVAAALGAARLDLLTEAGGVRDPRGQTLTAMTPAGAEAGVAAGWIGGGMRPKLETALGALARGVGAVRIVGPHGLADASAGTHLAAR